jgi:ornithine cyclodeaminase/alanine dehydrogenase-like protein (mu-crystallin family)
MQIIGEDQIRAAVSLPDAIDAVRAGFAAMAAGRVRLGGTIHLDVPEAAGELHVKGAHVEGEPYIVVKVAGGFYENPAKGLPVGPGMMLVIAAATGIPTALLNDNGWLTDVRTAAAGAVAADLLAKRRLSKVTVVGSGVQARLQLHALTEVREPDRVVIWGRDHRRAEQCASELADQLTADVAPARDLETAVREADLVITVTPSRTPLVRADWLSPGVHVTAVGSDGPLKRELESAVLQRADVMVVDSIEQCAQLGELHHALADGSVEMADVTGELGELVASGEPLRTSAELITVCDLTGVGVQDWAIATLVMSSVAADPARE